MIRERVFYVVLLIALGFFLIPPLLVGALVEMWYRAGDGGLLLVAWSALVTAWLLAAWCARRM